MRLCSLVLLCVLLLSGLAGAGRAEPLTVSGTVLDPAGQPLAGAEVLAMAIGAGGPRSLSLRTGADGTFSFQSEQTPGTSSAAARQRVVMARKAGLAPAVGLGRVGVPLTLRLGDKPEPRSLLLQAADGKALANLPVQMYCCVEAAADSVKAPAIVPLPAGELPNQTDGQGAVTLEGFAPGLVAEGSLRVPGYSRTAFRLEAAATTLVLRPEARVSGRVTVNGQPRVGLEVTASGQEENNGGHATTAADGTYTIEGLSPDEVWVCVHAPEGLADASRPGVKLKAGETTGGIDFTLTPGAVVRGKVTTGAGEAVVRARVMANLVPGPGGAAAVTGADGTYQLRLTPGEYRLSCQARPMDYAADDAATPTVTLREGDLLDGRDFTAEGPRRVRLLVLLPDGQPALKARVMELDGPDSRYNRLHWDPVAPGGLIEWSFIKATPPRDPNEYHPQPMLLITEPEQGLAALVSSQALPDPPTVTLRPAGTVTLTVQDRLGKPLSGFGVQVFYPRGGYAVTGGESVVADEHGEIRLTCLPTGLRLMIMPQNDLRRLMVGGDEWNGVVTLAAGEVRQLKPIVADPEGRVLHLFVGDAEGKPVAGADVYAGDARVPVRTDAAGKATATGLPAEGKLMVVAAHPTRELYAMDFVDPDAGVWPGLLLKPLGRATATLVSADGKPLAGKRVSCQPDHGRGWNWQLPHTLQQRLGLFGNTPALTTDDQGRFHAAGLVAGARYRVIVWGTVTANVREGEWASEVVTATGEEGEQDFGTLEYRARE